MNCPKCWNPSIPDNATSCPVCGAIFDQTAQQFGRLCPSGKHTMDPTWTSCAFCKAESPGSSADLHRPTVSEVTRGNAPGFGGSGPVGDPLPAPMGASAGPRKTISMSDLTDLRKPQPSVPPPMVNQAARGRVTVLGGLVPMPEMQPQVAALAPVAPVAATQSRIVAVLVCYSSLLNPAGSVYPVREGRNKIGANPESEIAFLVDPTMSGWHASVTFRDGKYYLSAKDTMTGTYLNGTEVPPDSTTLLTNYATIRAGSTAFRFIMVDPLEAPAS
jgi:hypothetical protein